MSAPKVRELESKMESLQMEVEDFKGAVKLQSVAMDKIHTSRLSLIHTAQLSVGHQVSIEEG